MVQDYKKKPPVPLGFSQALLLQAQHAGVSVDDMLARAEFPFNPLDTNPVDAPPVSAEQYSRLCLSLFNLLGDEAGGLIEGVSTPAGATRMLAYTMISCRSLADALKRAIEFNAACREPKDSVISHHVELDDSAQHASLVYRSSQTGRQDSVLCSMAIWLRFCAWLIDEEIDFLSADCAGAKPENLAALHHFYACPIRFDAEENRVEFSAAHLDSPVARDENELEAFLQEAPYYTLVKPPISENSISARIRELLGEDLREELPPLEALTQTLNMSARTLRRRLAKEGTSYQRIKDNARRDAAIAYLANPALTVSDVAELVGFSDPSAFHRSFKRWTGQSPGDFR